jgi:hypothetical protein
VLLLELTTLLPLALAAPLQLLAAILYLALLLLLVAAVALLLVVQLMVNLAALAAAVVIRQVPEQVVPETLPLQRRHKDRAVAMGIKAQAVGTAAVAVEQAQQDKPRRQLLAAMAAQAPHPPLAAHLLHTQAAVVVAHFWERLAEPVEQAAVALEQKLVREPLAPLIQAVAVAVALGQAQ